MQFQSIKAEWDTLFRQQQELQSACYNISVFTHHFDPEFSAEYKFVSFFNMETKSMDFSLLDSSDTAIKVLSEVPTEVMIAYAGYMAGVQAWERGDIEFPPYHPASPSVKTELTDVFDTLKTDQQQLNPEQVMEEGSMDHLVIKDELGLDTLAGEKCKDQ